MAVPLLISLALLVFKTRLVHYIGLGLLFAWMFYYYGGASIT
jgi:hypothetical protein